MIRPLVSPIVSPLARPLTGGRRGGPSFPALNPAKPLSSRVLMSGASYTNQIMPAYMDSFTTPGGGEDTTVSIIVGSNWIYRWENGELAEGGVDARAILESLRDTGEPGTDIFCITNISTQTASLEYINQGVLWNQLAQDAGTEVYFYQLWSNAVPDSTVHADFAGWRADLDVRIESWHVITDSVNALSGPQYNKVRLVPVGEVFARIYDEITGETSPGDIDNIWAFFGENNNDQVGDPHQSRLGKYVTAMVHYAVLFRRTPVGLPSYSATTGQTELLAPESLEWMQRLIWDVVQFNTRSGVRNYDPDPVWVLEASPGAINIYRAPGVDAPEFTETLSSDDTSIQIEA